MSDKYEDILRTLYELNERYHDVKERVVWLVGVIYLTFSVLAIGWYVENREKICAVYLSTTGERRCVTIFLFSVFLLTTTFIFLQTWHKVMSARKTTQFNELIVELDYRQGYSRTYKAIMDANTYNEPHKLRDFVWMGWSGHLIFSATYGFFLAQMVALHGFAFLFVSWVRLFLILLPYVLPLCSVLLQLVKGVR